MKEQDRQIRVCLLGEFSISVGNTVISGPLAHSKKLRGVAEYLLLHSSRPVPHEELYNTFWPDEKSANPRAALKTLVHRLRAALVQGGASEDIAFVTVRQGSYQWNPALHTQIDAARFEQLWTSLHGDALAPAAREQQLIELTGLYRGRLLEDAELWSAAAAAHLHDCYLRAVGELCDLWERDGRADQVISLCSTALTLDEMNETLNTRLITALAEAGRQQEAMTQYQRVTERYYDEYGVQVSEELRALYRRLAENDRATELDIDNVRSALQEHTAVQGAYVCEYGIFEDIYRIEERSLSRYGGRMFLGLLTLSDAAGQPIDPPVLARCMEQLLRVIRDSLRNCDIAARFSPTQYVVLLPTVTYESGRMVLDRIRQGYRRAVPRAKLSLCCKLRPMQPSGED